MRSRVGTTLLVAALIAAFLVEVRAGALANDARLLVLGALPDNGQIQHEYWRFLTFGFLHFNVAHFLLNATLLLWIGSVIERRIGASWIVALFLVASVASGAGILLKHHLHPAAGASVGASGGLFGLLGAAFVLFFRVPPASSAPRIAVAAVIVAGLAYSVLPGISMVGHVVGLTVGALLALVIPASAPPSGPTAAGA